METVRQEVLDLVNLSKGVSLLLSMWKLSVVRGFLMVNGETCSEKSSLSMGVKMWLINFMIPLLRSGFMSCNMSDVVAIAKHCRVGDNSRGVVQNELKGYNN